MNRTIIFLLIITLGLGCSDADEPQNKSRDVAPVTVVIAKSAKQSTDGYLQVSGVVEAEENAKISTRVMGYINKIYRDVGEQVSKGQLLVNLNTTDLQAQLSRVEANIQEAEAAMENAKLDFDRFTKLYETKSATLKELENVTTQYKMAESRVKAASQAKKEVESQFAYTNIKAPISGVVVQKMANEGDLASPGMPLLKIESNRNLKVVARIPESQIASIKIGDQAKIEIKAINKSLEAFVDEIAPSASYTGGQYLIKLKLMEQQESLFSGMFATVYLKSKEEKTENIFMIPKSAIVQQGQLSGVYTVNDENKALLRWLRLGRTSGNMVEVLAGLSPDEQYIASSTGKLYNGVPVVTQ